MRPRIPPPRKDRQRNRVALVTAAQEVYAEQGLDAPLDTIARRAGVGNATLYRHFPDRQLLIAEVLILNLTRSDRALTQALAAPSGWDGLVEYLTWLFAEQIDNAAYMSALRAVPAGADERVDLLRTTTLAALDELVARAKDQHTLRPDRWIEDIYLFLVLNEQLGHGEHADPHSASDRLLTLMLAALATDPPPAVVGEPSSVLGLRRSLASEVAGLRSEESSPQRDTR